MAFWSDYLGEGNPEIGEKTCEGLSMISKCEQGQMERNGLNILVEGR